MSWLLPVATLVPFAAQAFDTLRHAIFGNGQTKRGKAFGGGAFGGADMDAIGAGFPLAFSGGAPVPQAMMSAVPGAQIPQPPPGAPLGPNLQMLAPDIIKQTTVLNCFNQAIQNPFFPVTDLNYAQEYRVMNPQQSVYNANAQVIYNILPGGGYINNLANMSMVVRLKLVGAKGLTNRTVIGLAHQNPGNLLSTLFKEVSYGMNTHRAVHMADMLPYRHMALQEYRPKYLDALEKISAFFHDSKSELRHSLANAHIHTYPFTLLSGAGDGDLELTVKLPVILPFSNLAAMMISYYSFDHEIYLGVNQDSLRQGWFVTLANADPATPTVATQRGFVAAADPVRIDILESNLVVDDVLMPDDIIASMAKLVVGQRSELYPEILPRQLAKTINPVGNNFMFDTVVHTYSGRLPKVIYMFVPITIKVPGSSLTFDFPWPVLPVNARFQSRDELRSAVNEKWPIASGAVTADNVSKIITTANYCRNRYTGIDRSTAGTRTDPHDLEEFLEGCMTACSGSVASMRALSAQCVNTSNVVTTGMSITNDPVKFLHWYFVKHCMFGWNVTNCDIMGMNSQRLGMYELFFIVPPIPNGKIPNFWGLGTDNAVPATLDVVAGTAPIVTLDVEDIAFSYDSLATTTRLPLSAFTGLS